MTDVQGAHHTFLPSLLLEEDNSESLATAPQSSHERVDVLYPKLQSQSQALFSAPPAVTSSGSHKRTRPEEEAAAAPEYSPHLMLQYGTNGAVIGLQHVLTPVSSGVLSDVIMETSAYKVVGPPVVHPNFDLQISKLNGVGVFQGYVLRWSPLSLGFGIEGERPAKRPRLSEEIYVVVVSARNSGFSPEMDENGIFTQGVLTFSSQNLEYILGHIQRSDLGNVKMRFSSSERLTPRHNGAAVFIEGEDGGRYLIGMVSAHLMAENPEAPILNLTHPAIARWIIEQCHK
jgi:hypothetical protein